MSYKPFLFDPRIQTGYTVWHQDPKLAELIKTLVTDYPVSRFVETGTHMGWTLMWMAHIFPNLPIYSVEIDRNYFEQSVTNCKPYPNIMLRFGDSVDFLKNSPILPLKTGLTLFWLDAHWWDPVPLREECKVVSQLLQYLVLIDDFASNNPRFGGDVFKGGHENNLEYVADIMGKKCWRPNYESYPPDHKGYGLFVKGVEFKAPDYLKEDVLP